MIFALLNQKGGVGKTTLSIHLSAALARAGSRILLVDADPQHSAMKWSSLRSGPPAFNVVGMAKPTLHKEIVSIAADYSHVVIDGPPRIADLARSIIMAADLVIVPVQPSPMDVWATAETTDLLNEAIVFKESLKGVIAINRKIVNTAIGHDVREALATLRFPVMQADISQRVAFAEASAGGQTVLDMDPKGRAAREIEAFLEEILTTYDHQEDHHGSQTRPVVARSG
ncbi:MAG: AAA family ATPase [Beggiatoa sp.]|nr:AAA family ATPase [Beggiatoa sp.]